MLLNNQNLDFTDHAKLWAISMELVNRSNEYAKARKEYADAKYDFDIAVARELPLLRQKKPNIGVETAQIMILETNTQNREIYKKLIETENYYKGLERILDAIKSQITLSQSLIKNQNNQGAS